MILTYGLALNKMTLVVLYPLSISMDGHDIRHEDFSDFYALFSYTVIWTFMVLFSISLNLN